MGGSVPVWFADMSVARQCFDEICALYDAVFSAPPFSWRADEPQLHRDRLDGLLADDTFGITLAQAGGRLVGFAYGFALKPQTRWWEGITPEPAPEVIRERPGRTFVLYDFAVAREHRGMGIGRRLHDLLLGRRTEERATLATQPTALDTKRIYERWGWHLLGQAEGGPTAAAPLFDVYIRDRIDDLRPDQPSNR